MLTCFMDCCTGLPLRFDLVTYHLCPSLRRSSLSPISSNASRRRQRTLNSLLCDRPSAGRQIRRTPIPPPSSTPPAGCDEMNDGLRRRQGGLPSPNHRLTRPPPSRTEEAASWTNPSRLGPKSPGLPPWGRDRRRCALRRRPERGDGTVPWGETAAAAPAEAGPEAE